MASYGWIRFLVVLTVGVLGVGLVSSKLQAIGYTPTVSGVVAGHAMSVTIPASEVVWLVGYGLTAFVLWYGWLRKIDLVGDGGASE